MVLISCSYHRPPLPIPQPCSSIPQKIFNNCGCNPMVSLLIDSGMSSALIKEVSKEIGYDLDRLKDSIKMTDVNSLESKLKLYIKENRIADKQIASEIAKYLNLIRNDKENITTLVDDWVECIGLYRVKNKLEINGFGVITKEKSKQDENQNNFAFSVNYENTNLDMTSEIFPFFEIGFVSNQYMRKFETLNQIKQWEDKDHYGFMSIGIKKYFGILGKTCFAGISTGIIKEFNDDFSFSGSALLSILYFKIRYSYLNSLTKENVRFNPFGDSEIVKESEPNNSVFVGLGFPIRW